MLGVGVFSLVGLLLGVVLGRELARRGLTADTVLARRQKQLYVVLVGLAALGFAFYTLGRPGHRGSWVPVAIMLYIEHFLWPLVAGVAGFGIGLVARLEWPGRRERKRLGNLVVGPGVLAAALAFIAYNSWPVTSMLGAAALRDGVVMQTTSYTCAPAAIATLARFSGFDTAATERRMIALTRTDRHGTSTLQEMRAMRALGMAPRFEAGLEVQDLAASAVPALLHVDEPVGSTTIRHAVALLTVDGAAREVVLGNPLYGRQVRRFDQMRGYWMGEAVFLTARR